MEIALQQPRLIQLSGATHELLAQVSAAVARLNERRPLAPHLDARLRKELLPDRVTASLNMEGIIATRRQTLAVMDAMRVQEAVGQGEREIYNALTADEFIEDAVDQGINLSEQFVREVNRLILAQIRDDAGVYRPGAVELRGAHFTPPQGPAVAPLMNDLVQLFPHSESLHPTVQACWLHEQFTLIHPFNDGNGRTGRLLQDWALIRRGCLPIGIPSSERDHYYASLEAADKGDWDELVEMTADLQLKMVSRVQAIIDDADNRAGWITRLATAAATKKDNARHKQYVVWRQRVEDVTASFGQAARQLDASSSVIGVTFREYGVLDFREWEEVCRRGYSERSWAFSALFFGDGKPFYKAIAYLKRHVPLPRVDPFEPPKDAIAIYFTGTTAPEGPRPNFVKYEDPHIRLREILHLDDQRLVYRQESPGEDWALSDEPALGGAIEQFFVDLFGRKLGLGA